LRNAGVLTRRNCNLSEVNPKAVEANAKNGAKTVNTNQNVTLKVENLVVREEADITRVAT